MEGVIPVEDLSPCGRSSLSKGLEPASPGSKLPSPKFAYREGLSASGVPPQKSKPIERTTPRGGPPSSPKHFLRRQVVEVELAITADLCLAIGNWMVLSRSKDISLAALVSKETNSCLLSADASRARSSMHICKDAEG